MKTKKGTELQLLKLKGKDYLPVAQRLVWFREEHPDWSLETSFLKLEDAYTIAKAEVRTAEGRILGTGHKREDQKHFADHMEKAETGAIGRALALCGYGTQFAPEMDEEHRIVDTPQAVKYASEEDIAELLIYASDHGIAAPRVAKLASLYEASLDFLPVHLIPAMKKRMKDSTKDGAK